MTMKASTSGPPPDYQQVFEAMPGPCLLLDGSFHIVAANGAYLKATSRSREELIGQEIFDAFPDNPADGKATGTRNLRASLEKVRATHKPDTMGIQRYDIPMPDGAFEERYWTPRNLPLFDAKGDVVNILHCVEDVTEHLLLRRHDASLQTHVTDLEKELYRRNREIEEQVIQLQEAHAQLALQNRRKDQFLAMLAHELRNPLAAIDSGIELLRHLGSDPITTLNSKGEILQIMGLQIEHLRRLVDDLMDVSRITEQRFELQREPVLLADVIERAVDMMRPFIEARNQKLEVKMPSESLRIEADLVRLTQVFTNLLHNAAKYSSEGSRIEIVASVLEDQAKIDIRDEGRGIDPEELPYVFDAFVQADTSLERTLGGLGLGLTLVKRIVEMHGGRVEAKSPGPGRGSTFTVLIPVETIRIPGTRLAEVARARSLEATESKRLLLVEDNPDIAHVMDTLLKRMGHEVETVQDGLTAIKVAPHFCPDVVLLDIGLPGLDGFEVARRLRKNEATAHTTIIAITGYGLPEHRLKGEEAAFDLHLIKPVDIKILHDVIMGLPTLT